MEALKGEGVNDLGATGYCFGGMFWFLNFVLTTKDINQLGFVWLGRYAFDLAFNKVIKVAVASHPSLLKIPDDLEVSSFCFSSISLFHVSLFISSARLSYILSYRPVHIFWPCRFINLTFKTLEIPRHFKSSSPYQLVWSWSTIPTRSMCESRWDSWRW